jgi:hypothetical protein
MWDSLRQEIDPTIAAVSTVLITISIVILLCAELLRKRTERTRTAAWDDEGGRVTGSTRRPVGQSASRQGE